MKRIFAAVLVLACLLGAVSAGEADSQAQYERAVACYEAGEYEEALQLLALPVEQGLAAAQNMLGICYRNGTGVEQDYAEAVRWYTLAAEQGLDIAQYNLAGMYHLGEGVEQDEYKGFLYIKQAAEEGCTEAYTKLAEQDYVAITPLVAGG